MTVESRLQREHHRAFYVLWGAVGFQFIAAALALVFAWLLSTVIANVFIAHQTLSDVSPQLLVMIALLLVRAGLLWATEIVAQHAANGVKSNLRARLLAALFARGPTFTRGERTGELVHTTTAAVETLDEYLTQYHPARLLARLVPALVLVVILLLDPWTLPILLFAGPILVILLALIGKRTQDLTRRRHLEMAWMSAHFMDMLQGIATLKMFGRSREQIDTIETISRQYGKATMDVLRTAFQTSLVLEWGATAATALVAIEVSVRLMNGMLPFALALTVLLITPEFFLPLRNLALKYHAGAAGKAAAESIYAILDAPAPTPRVVSPNQTRRAPTRRDIFFENVYANYDDGARRALNGFTLALDDGQTVALVGATGAGKTTVANLLLRFLEPSGGSITIGGVPLQDMDAAEWRAHVAWVPQHPHLFHGTVAENLRIAKPDASAQEMFAAARAAHAHEFIAQLPRGFDTFLGERGARLSGGQAQRLAIARAFLKDAPLLILDEATAHLDRENEELIRAALARLMQNRTVLLISHRLQFARDADVIAVMENGRVVEITTPRETRDAHSRYAQLLAASERSDV